METLDRTLVVDADGHVDEGNVDLTSRLPERWRSQTPVRVKDNEGNPRLLLEGRIWGAGSAGPHPSVSGPMTDKARKGRPGMIDPLARLGDMDLEGIDVAVLFGTQIALTVNGLMNGELAAALCHAVNEWLLQYCSADPRRLRAVGLIPCQAPAAAVKELEYCARHGATSVMLPNNVYGRNLGDPIFHPIYEAAEKIGMTLCVHPQTGHDGVPGVSGVMGAGSERFFKYVYVHMTAFPFELMIAMMHMIGEGVFDRFPRLRVGFMEGGAGWLPFWMERLDEHVEKLAPQMPNLKRRPSEIIRSEQVVLTCESEESGLDRVLAAAGPGTVLYASDYCHWDCNFPDSVRDICAAPDLSPAQKERVLGLNAVEFFRLDNLPEPRALGLARAYWRNAAGARGGPGLSAASAYGSAATVTRRPREPLR
jgi:predicted TIM-barrel fold metal-dependent hydrolase